jgi:hypothetical protein
MKEYIQDFAASCDAFQRNKGEMVKIPGSLKSFPIPTQIWINISMNFIAGHPEVGNK